jgi:hypothetical protein
MAPLRSKDFRNIDPRAARIILIEAWLWLLPQNRCRRFRLDSSRGFLASLLKF